ncbi:MAG: Wzz/FepE/Etk N-terminal domain-containing protein [Steroidobacteraceae bacterium]
MSDSDPEVGRRLAYLESHVSSARNSREVNLSELMRKIWERKWLVLAAALCFAVLSAVVVLRLPNQYKASAVLASAESSKTSGMLSQLNGLASLAGVSVNSDEEDESQIAMAVLQSWNFIDQFIRNNHLEVAVFAAKGWDRATNQLLIDDDLYDVSQKKWVRVPPKGKTVEPTSWELYQKFSDRLTVLQDKKTGLLTVSYEYYSPQVARDWVDGLVKAINEHMRQRKLESSTNNINFLQEQIDKTPLADMRAVLYQLVANETKNKMLAAASPEYQYVVVSPAMVPEEKSKPQRVLIVLGVTLVGTALAIFFLLNRAQKPASAR